MSQTFTFGIHTTISNIKIKWCIVPKNCYARHFIFLRLIKRLVWHDLFLITCFFRVWNLFLLFSYLSHILVNSVCAVFFFCFFCFFFFFFFFWLRALPTDNDDRHTLGTGDYNFWRLRLETFVANIPYWQQCWFCSVMIFISVFW